MLHLQKKQHLNNRAKFFKQKKLRREICMLEEQNIFKDLKYKIYII